VLKLLAKFAPLDGLGIAIQDVEFRVITLAQKRISKRRPPTRRFRKVKSASQRGNSGATYNFP
jgi:hypothetical protein